MRRTVVIAGGAVVLVATALVLFRPSFAGPREAAPAPASAPAEGAAPLPIGQVVLYSSGVGYFQREGTVTGSTRVDLSFPVSDINDLLKSLVLRDLDGGHVAAISYDANAPLQRTLQSFAINLTANPALADILNQARGEKVEVALTAAQANQPALLTGSLLGVEKQRQPAGKDGATREVAVLNLWCTDGMRALQLGEVQRVRFLNPVIEGEMRKALEALAQGHDAQKKGVSLYLDGEGKRRVRVSYVVENPVWKTSYRLVLDKGEAKPFLQGWAVVDNATDEDWKDVRMALVAGRPLSFRMDLYQPLYVPRPLVELERFASLRPPAYEGALDAAKKPQAPAAAGSSLQFGLSVNGTFSEKAGAAKDRGAAYGRRLREALDKPMDLARSGVSAMATATRLGDNFQYAIDRPVSLPRQKSALLPILNKEVTGERVSIYNEAVQAKFPLLGLRLHNDSGLHLMQGPVTLFEGSAYAGDARLPDLQPGEKRLISYAVDLAVEVDPKPGNHDGRLTRLKAVKGLLYATTTFRQSKTYTVANRSAQPRLVLVEHPNRQGFTLVDTPAPAETARDVYRFELKVPAGKTERQTVTEEHLQQQTIALSNSGDEQIKVFVQSPAVSPAVKKGLEKAQQLRWQWQEVQREVAQQQRQLKAITEDQGRLRANLKEMPATATAYKRYLQKFDQQETEIEKLQEQIKTLEKQEHQRRKAFEDFLASFSAE